MAHSNLVENWKTVLILSISFWAQVAGLLVLIVPELIFAYTGIDTNPAVLWWAGMLLLLFGLVGRLFKQSNVAWVEWLRTSTVFFIIALLALVASSQSQASTKQEATLDIAVPLIAKWEGLRLQAYLDIVGVPTICYGSTRGVSLGTRKTERQCEQLLRVEVAEYRCGWLGYVLPEVAQSLPPKRDAAYTSLTYNAGIRAIGRSTATRRLNAGDTRGGCYALGWWNKAGGRVIRGLVNRRNEEVKLCLEVGVV